MAMPVQVFTPESWMSHFGDWFVPEPNTGCWLWTRAGGEGYGRITSNYRNLLAHRLSYELLRGPIPEGLEIDHLCRTPSCVNPAHMEPVTKGANVLRGRGITAMNLAKSHCPQGHAYDLTISFKKRGRHCRECRAEAVRAYQRRKREARGA